MVRSLSGKQSVRSAPLLMKKGLSDLDFAVVQTFYDGQAFYVDACRTQFVASVLEGLFNDEAHADQLGTGLALADADATEPAATACEPDPITRLENRNLLTVGYVEANAALRRTESRGAHARTDYPESCDEWAQSIAYINA